MTLWSYCRVDLALTEAEFWRLSPLQVVALAERDEGRRKIEDRRVGVICSTFVNLFKTKGRRTKPEEFMPRYRQQTSTEMLQFVEMLNEAMGGRDLRDVNAG